MRAQLFIVSDWGTALHSKVCLASCCQHGTKCRE